MSHRKIVFSLDEFYHLYSRGVDKGIIFRDDLDRKRFVRLLYLCNGNVPVVYKDYRDMLLADIDPGPKLTAIGAYCLMPNHFHLMVKETSEGGVVKFMGKLLTAYSSYFNKKYMRTGPLFSSEFKSQHLNTDEYLKYIFSYIHLNPMKLLDPEWREKPINTNKAYEFLNRYRYSSYEDYAVDQHREESGILTKAVFPDYFATPADFALELEEWISYKT